jgi:hypothetical protein
MYFLLARDGVYLAQRSPLYDAITRFDGTLPGLAPQQAQLHLHLPKLPQWLVECVVGFFLDVFRRYGTEALVVMFYAPGRGFRIRVPRQEPSRLYVGLTNLGGYHLRYDRCPRPEGFLQLGTIHSHGDLPAMHSCVDEADEQYLDGLHLTVGDLTASRPSFSAAFVANGHRFTLAPEDVLAGYDRPRLPAPPQWLAQIRCRTFLVSAWHPSHDTQQKAWHDATPPASRAAEDSRA